jgi:hypothetical protein
MLHFSLGIQQSVDLHLDFCDWGSFYCSDVSTAGHGVSTQQLPTRLLNRHHGYHSWICKLHYRSAIKHLRSSSGQHSFRRCYHIDMRVGSIGQVSQKFACSPSSQWRVLRYERVYNGSSYCRHVLLTRAWLLDWRLLVGCTSPRTMSTTN